MHKAAARSRELDALSEVERSCIAESLTRQRRLERSGFYTAPQISRGILKAQQGKGAGYNEAHGVFFHEVLAEEFRRCDGTVRLLDMGCGPGYFLRSMIEFARASGRAGRFEAHGVTLAKTVSAVVDPQGSLKTFKPVVGDDVIHIGHGENLKFPDGYFNMVVSTFGPTNYHTGGYARNRTKRSLEEAYRVTMPGGRIFVADGFPKGAAGQERLDAFREFETGHKDATVLIEPQMRYLRLRVNKSGLPDAK
jgi:SAM-dependent methyltransferase